MKREAKAKRIFNRMQRDILELRGMNYDVSDRHSAITVFDLNEVQRIQKESTPSYHDDFMSDCIVFVFK